MGDGYIYEPLNREKVNKKFIEELERIFEECLKLERERKKREN